MFWNQDREWDVWVVASQEAVRYLECLLQHPCRSIWIQDGELLYYFRVPAEFRADVSARFPEEYTDVLVHKSR